MPDQSDRNVEQLSAYLDGELTEAERATLEARLQANPALYGELDSLRQTVALVRSLPRLAAPRSFALTAAQAGLAAARPRPLPFYVSAAFSVLSAAAAIALVALGGYLLTMSAPAPAALPAALHVAAAPTSASAAQVPIERQRITALPTLPAADVQGFESADSARAQPPAAEALAGGAPAVSDSATPGAAAPEAAAAAPQPTLALALTATAAPTEIAQGGAAAEADQLEEQPAAPAEIPSPLARLSPAALLAGGLALLALAAGTTLARRRARRRL